jgi:hypothetical protein
VTGPRSNQRKRKDGEKLVKEHEEGGKKETKHKWDLIRLSLPILLLPVLSA